MKKKFLFAFLFCIVLVLASISALGAASVTLRAGTGQGESNSTVQVPIEVRGAPNVGALQFDLVYDPQVVQLDMVARGALAANALVDFNNSVPGRARIGIVTTEGIRGDGTLALVNFKLIGSAGTHSPLQIENARAWDTPDHFEVLVAGEAGAVNILAGAQSDFTLLFIGALVLFAFLILLIALVLARRQRRGSNANPPPVADWTCKKCRTLNPTNSHFCGNCSAAR